MTLSRTIKAASIVFLAGSLACPQGPSEQVHYTQVHMGVQVHITVYALDRPGADAGCRAAFARIEALDAVCSDYRPDSELNRLCAQAGGPPVAVSEDLYRVLAEAHSLAERSGGAFDATVGPYVRLWREARRKGRLPDEEAWREARRLVGWRKVGLDSQARTVRLREPGMRLDLGGIAKGYALDAALAVLRERGLSRALVAAGGDIAAGDPPPGRPGWRIRLWRAARGTRWLTVANCGVSTSGDTEQFAEARGRRYSHIIDPRLGLLRYGEPKLATVVAPCATLSDGLATACIVLDEAEARRLVEATPGAKLYLRVVPGR